MKTFEKLTAPLNAFLLRQSSQIDKESSSKSLFFGDFTLKMVYAIVMHVPSLRRLVTDLETRPSALNLGFSLTAYSTLRDGFNRFTAGYFRKAFLEVLKSYDWMRMAAVDEVGIIKLVDGSLFPTLASMDWASYKKDKNAIRLHLSLELNRMIPTEFITQKANSCERSFLLSILEKGRTYVADRGYFSFRVGDLMAKANAFFIIRVKSNLKFTALKDLPITSLKARTPECFSQMTDRLVQFDNDEFERTYRLITFTVLQSQFMICTNRFKLTTMQIIMLYAYRWQVELMFKFIKRTLNGIHLFNHSENGVAIHFYLFMIVALLKLRIKQTCQRKAQQLLEQKRQLEDLNDYYGTRPEEWIASTAADFYQHWKIGIHWLCHLRNLIDHVFDDGVIKKLAYQ